MPFSKCMRCAFGSRSVVSLASGTRNYSSMTALCLSRAPPQQYVSPYAPVSSNPVVFMDIAVEGDVVGRVHMELFRDAAPKAAEHFRSLCTGERGGGGRFNPRDHRDPARGSGYPGLSYQGVPFHRIIPGFVVQGGDVLTKDGRSNASLLGYSYPPDTASSAAEKTRRHLPGTLALAHIDGDPHHCGSQFFWNLRHNAHLEDGKFLVIGQVLGADNSGSRSAWESVVLAVARSCGSRSGLPVSRAWVVSCGQSGGYLAEEAAQAVRENLKGDEEVSLLRPSPVSAAREMVFDAIPCRYPPTSTRPAK